MCLKNSDQTYFKHFGCMYRYLKKSKCPEYKGWAKRSLFESAILVQSIWLVLGWGIRDETFWIAKGQFYCIRMLIYCELQHCRQKRLNMLSRQTKDCESESGAPLHNHPSIFNRFHSIKRGVILTFYTFCSNKKPEAKPRAFYSQNV